MGRAEVVNERARNVLICRRRATEQVDELPLCDARSMTDKPRYQLRANGVALSRLQWWVCGFAFCVGTCSMLLRLAGKAPLGGAMVPAIAAITVGVTVIIAGMRRPGH